MKAARRAFHGLTPVAFLALAAIGGPAAPPAFLTQPQSQASALSSNVVFSASAAGAPPLFYHWRRNGTNLSDAGNLSGSTSTNLSLTNLSSSDAGLYSVVVSNADGSVASTNAVLSIDIAQNGGFESASLAGWSQSGNTGSSYLTSGPTFAHSGGYGFAAGPAGGLGYLSQTLPTSPGQSCLISFWLNSPGGSFNEFLVSWNGLVLFDHTNLPAIGWTNLQFLVGVTDTNSVLRFGFRNDPRYFGLDDVTVTIVPTPPLRVTALGFATNGAFQLAVDGLPGQTYTLQASTDLTHWSSLLGFTCANSPAYVADSVAGNYSRRFYRLVQGDLLVPITLGFGSARPFSARGLSLMLQGPAGSSYTIQASADLVHWDAITNFTATNSPAFFYDPGATNYSRRFYRAKLES